MGIRAAGEAVTKPSNPPLFNDYEEGMAGSIVSTDITLRDLFFAFQAAAIRSRLGPEEASAKWVAEWALRDADAMLAAREETS